MLIFDEGHARSCLRLYFFSRTATGKTSTKTTIWKKIQTSVCVKQIPSRRAAVLSQSINCEFIFLAYLYHADKHDKITTNIQNVLQVSSLVIVSINNESAQKNA